MKWIGRHIWDFISRFRKNVYLEESLIIEGDNKKVFTPTIDGIVIHVDQQVAVDNDTSASGLNPHYRQIVFENSQLQATNSNVTTDTATTVYIKGAPVAGTNQTITNDYALWVDSSKSYFGGGIIANLGVTGNVTGNVSGSSGSCTGNAATATLAATSTLVDAAAASTTYYPVLVDGLTGAQALEAESELTFVGNTGILTATGFAGALTGNVTGNVSGTAATVTSGTQASITTCANLATVGTITTGTWQGTAIASAYLDSDTAHLSGIQTFTGIKTFDAPVILDGDKNITPSNDGVSLHVDAQDITDTDTSASGTANVFNYVAFESPRLLATNSSVTTTHASTVYIKGAPVAYTNQTITNAYALYVAGGDSYFHAAITANGGVTGDLTGNASTATALTAGDKTISGDLTVTGNDIKDSSGSAAITFDGSANTQVRGNLDVTGIITGKQRQIYQQSFIDDLATTKHYLPWRDTDEQTTIYQEEAAMVAPYDGRIVSVTMRCSSVSGTGNRTIGIHTFGPNASQFTTGNWTQEETESNAISSTDDNHVFYYVFDNAKHFESGELVVLSIEDDADLTSGQRYTYISTVVEWDYNNGLGTGASSAEYDSAQ